MNRFTSFAEETFVEILAEAAADSAASDEWSSGLRIRPDAEDALASASISARSNGHSAHHVSDVYASAFENDALKTSPALSLERLVEIELGLENDMSVEDLRKARRRYANQNHPDRVAISLRAIADQKMTLANALVDARISAIANKGLNKR